MHRLSATLVFLLLANAPVSAELASRHAEPPKRLDHSPQCPDWENEFREIQADLKSYRAGLLDELRALGGGSLPSCRSDRMMPPPPPNLQIREGSIDLHRARGLERLAEKLDHFRYQVIPPRYPPPPGTRLRTLIIMGGGPGNYLSKRPYQSRNDNYQVLIADYVGMGKNAIKEMRSGKDDQLLDLDLFSRLMEQVIRKEVDAGALGEYVLFGHSFGSAAATVLGAHLSQLHEEDNRYKPTAVLLGGVAPFATIEPGKRDASAAQAPSQVQEIEWQPRMMATGLCLLPQGTRCFDDRVLELVSAEQRAQIKKNLAVLFRNYERTKRTPLQRFVRDAFHWEVSDGPRQAADFLSHYFTDGANQAKMYCWYKAKFDDIVFLHRYESPSQMAAIAALNCHLDYQDPMCRCFPHQSLYTSQYQVRSPIRLYYVNGDRDSQTPLEGALMHFEQQLNPRKIFLKVPFGGHGLYARSGGRRAGGRREGTLDLDEVLKTVFEKPLEAFHSLSTAPAP